MKLIASWVMESPRLDWLLAANPHCRCARGSVCQLRRPCGLPLDLARRLVFAQADENRVTKKALSRPTQIGDLGDQLRPDPMDLGQFQRPSEAVVARRGAW
jgi:hypothetical protein